MAHFPTLPGTVGLDFPDDSRSFALADIDLDGRPEIVQPLQAPDFSLPDLAGTKLQLSSLRGHFVLLHLWATAAPACGKQLHLLQENLANFVAHDLGLFCINVDDPQDGKAVRSFAKREGISLPILLATGVVAGVYNIFYRFLFDRPRDLGIQRRFC
jgi:AhpC/TSA family protein